jgi:hypothetical protein
LSKPGQNLRRGIANPDPFKLRQIFRCKDRHPRSYPIKSNLELRFVLKLGRGR